MHRMHMFRWMARRAARCCYSVRMTPLTCVGVGTLDTSGIDAFLEEVLSVYPEMKRAEDV
jgi:hypothetical protein